MNIFLAVFGEDTLFYKWMNISTFFLILSSFSEFYFQNNLLLSEMYELN